MGWFRRALNIGPDKDQPGLQEQLSIAPFTTYNNLFSIPLPQRLLEFRYLRSVEEYQIAVQMDKDQFSIAELNLVQSWTHSATINDLLANRDDKRSVTQILFRTHVDSIVFQGLPDSVAAVAFQPSCHTQC